MAPHLRRLSARDVCQGLGRLGFEIVAVRGSQAKLCRTTPGDQRQTLTVPLHRELSAGALRAIVRQAGRFVPEEELRRLFFRDPRRT